MKKIIYIISVLVLGFAAAACQQKEIVATPEFTVLDDNGDVVLKYGESKEMLLDLAYYEYSKSANKNNEVLAASFYRVKSNCSWRLVAQDADKTWVRAYPGQGEKDGAFGFFLDRNNDQENPRSAVFKVVMNDGAQDIPVGGEIVITQSAAVDFLKTNKESIEINKEGGNGSVTITSNVAWTYSLTPNEDYASPAIAEWIKDNTELKEGSVTQTLKFKFSDNSDGSIRGATLTLTATDHPELSKKLEVTQYGVEIEVEGFPVSWPGAAGNSAYPKWPSATNAVPTIEATEGKGTITFVPGVTTGLDRSASSTDCSGSNPRVNGAWPGDYWLFTVPSAVSAGSLIKLQFEGRISGSGIQHWRLEYKDGEEWKIIGTPKTMDLPEGAGWPAETITYTHDMAPGGLGDEFNKVISAVVRYENTVPEVAFRFVAASNVIASSGERMEKPTSASVRLDNSGAETGCDASISCVASGGEIKYADIQVIGLDKDYILFDGTPKAPVKFNVLADDDFTVSTDASWVTVTKGATGVADEATEVEITCEPSTLSDPREATITVLAGVTRYTIGVVQSAAGQQLDPFISLSTGNSKEVNDQAGSFIVKVQTNTTVDIQAPEWVSVTSLATKGLVERVDYKVEYEANEAIDTPRTGVIRFFNEEAGVESVLTLNQAGAPGKVIYFRDDFEWLSSWTASAPDDVANNSVGSAINVFTSDAAAGFLDEFQSRGYGYIWGWKDQAWSDGTPDNGNKQTLYLCKNYLKFGKTTYSSGIVLPVLSKIEGSADIDVKFDWCWCMTGKSKPDTMTLTVEVSGGGTIASTGTTVSDEILSAQPTEGDLTKLEWQHAKVRIVGATSATRVTIRPTNNDPKVSNAARDQNRWYLDNIEVVPAEVVTYFQDDFEWLSGWTASAPDDVTNNSVGSAINVFTSDAATGFLDEFQSRGYGYIWGWKDQDWSDGLPDNGNKQTLYLCKNYLKFGKTTYSSGIVLPALSKIEGTADVDLIFDWCWCMTGKSKPDTMTLTAVISGGGTFAGTGTAVSAEITSAQPTEGDLTKLEWQHVKLSIKGATPATRVTIRPTNNDPKVSNAARDQNRWYLDNIKVVE